MCLVGPVFGRSGLGRSGPTRHYSLFVVRTDQVRVRIGPIAETEDRAECGQYGPVSVGPVRSGGLLSPTSNHPTIYANNK